MGLKSLADWIRKVEEGLFLICSRKSVSMVSSSEMRALDFGSAKKVSVISSPRAWRRKSMCRS